MRILGAFTAVAALGGALVLSGCGSSPGPSSSSDLAAGQLRPSRAPASKPFGATITGPTGAQYTVLAFQQVQPKPATDTPTPRGSLLCSEMCRSAPRSAPSLTADPTQWLGVFSGNEQAQGRDATQLATPGPPLASATVATGQCVSGWVAFTGFADGIPREIHLAGLSSVVEHVVAHGRSGLGPG